MFVGVGEGGGMLVFGLCWWLVCVCLGFGLFFFRLEVLIIKNLSYLSYKIKKRKNQTLL